MVLSGLIPGLDAAERVLIYRCIGAEKTDFVGTRRGFYSFSMEKFSHLGVLTSSVKLMGI